MNGGSQEQRNLKGGAEWVCVVRVGGHWPTKRAGVAAPWGRPLGLGEIK